MSALYKFIATYRNHLLLLAFAFSLLVPTAFVNAEELPVGVSERQTCGTYSVDIFGYGAGMMYTTDPITVTNRRVAYLNASEECAVIEWGSNIPAASQVLIAKLGDEPVTIDTTKENFGYPISSTQNNAGISNHRAIVYGLEPNEAYSYRLVTRAHPSALPVISDAQVLVTGTTAEFSPVNTTVSTNNATSAGTVVIGVPSTPTVPATGFDFEKFPTAPTDSASPSEAVSGADGTGATTDDKVTTDDTPEASTTVPSAATAADSALANSQERKLFKGVRNFFARLLPEEGRLSLTSNVGLFEEDKYIVPTLFFLGLVFLLQRLVLPAFGLTLKKPVLYWLIGSVVLTVLSALFMMYYVTLIGIALFLGLLAWYLLKNTPTDDTASPQLKLLETKESKDSKRDEKKPQKGKK